MTGTIFVMIRSKVLFMKLNPLFILLLLVSANVNAQPFRYIEDSDAQRDSISKLKISRYTEYSSTYEDSNNRILSSIVEFDRNGNKTRDYRFDLYHKSNYQMTWLYDDFGRIIEQTSYSPDSLTIHQKIYHCYDDRGNKVEYINEIYSNGLAQGNSRTVYGYDSLNHLISLKVYNKKGLQTHYEYRYHPNGYRIQELTYSADGKLLRTRPVAESHERTEPYGLPMPPNPEIEALLKETIIKDPNTGNTIYKDGYGIREFTNQGLLIYWYQDHFKHHWYHYSFYK